MENKLLATVAGTPITQADVNEFLSSLGQRASQYDTPEGRAMILDEIIGSKLLLMDAKRNLYEAEPAFAAQLKKVKENLLAGYAAQKAVAGVSVSEEEVRKYYEENKENLVGSPSVNASHILVDTREKASDILGKIRAGELSFEEAAKQYSSCPSKENGGNLGDFGQGQMVPEFEKAAFAMEVGQISEPVKTQFGYHLIRLNEKKTAETIPYEKLRDHIKAQLLKEKQGRAYESKINQLKILYPVDKF